MSLPSEIKRRRTFGIISHPDAGKTTLTEKLLLFGGAIQEAGAVKSNKVKKGATSDFMEIERQRGISVATSVLAFEYEGIKINITAVFTSHQLDKIKLSINRSTPVIISIFCGRIADNGIDPEIIVKKAIKSFKNYKNVKILWASTREVYNFFQANIYTY